MDSTTRKRESGFKRGFVLFIFTVSSSVHQAFMNELFSKPATVLQF